MSFPVFLIISYILYFFNDEWCLLELYSSAELIRTLGEVGLNGLWMKLRMTFWEEKQAFLLCGSLVSDFSSFAGLQELHYKYY